MRTIRVYLALIRHQPGRTLPLCLVKRSSKSCGETLAKPRCWLSIVLLNMKNRVYSKMRRGFRLKVQVCSLRRHPRWLCKAQTPRTLTRCQRCQWRCREFLGGPRVVRTVFHRALRRSRCSVRHSLPWHPRPSRLRPLPALPKHLRLAVMSNRNVWRKTAVFTFFSAHTRSGRPMRKVALQRASSTLWHAGTRKRRQTRRRRRRFSESCCKMSQRTGPRKTMMCPTRADRWAESAPDQQVGRGAQAWGQPTERAAAAAVLGATTPLPRSGDRAKASGTNRDAPRATIAVVAARVGVMANTDVMTPRVPTTATVWAPVCVGQATANTVTIATTAATTFAWARGIEKVAVGTLSAGTVGIPKGVAVTMTPTAAEGAPHVRRVAVAAVVMATTAGGATPGGIVLPPIGETRGQTRETRGQTRDLHHGECPSDTLMPNVNSYYSSSLLW